MYLQSLRGVKNDCETAYLRVCCVWQNLGCIKSSNLCTEIIEYTDPDEVGSILPIFDKRATAWFFRH